ncbi:uncharacterized protein VTP21DRAFT_3432 [Calcarisporiella thermophila]|uniref:uncharacterized protein n=1 Tax=Calcarisporiella thermophila TaxID=911321 RepID=UPI003743D87B
MEETDSPTSDPSSPPRSPILPSAINEDEFPQKSTTQIPSEKEDSPLPSPRRTPSHPTTSSTTVTERKHVLRYDASWPIYGLDWSRRPSEQEAWRLALGSLMEDCVNKLQVVTLPEYVASVEVHSSRGDFAVLAETDIGYPVTKVLWEPWKGGSSSTDLLATTSDFVRIWELGSSESEDNNLVGKGESAPRQSLGLKATLKNTKSDFSAPLTSIDWCESDPALLVSSSIDTTCTLWNVETQQTTIQLVAHEKEVYDVAFMPGSASIFATVGADGTARLFDTRCLEQSRIIYSSPFSPVNANSLPVIPGVSLLRLQFNKINANLIATLHVATNIVHVLDIRTSQPLVELRGHSSPVNAIGWAPHLSNLLVSGGDDSQVLVWDLDDPSSYAPHLPPGAPPPTAQKIVHHPILAYTADAEVNQLCWSGVMPDRMGISFGRRLQVLKI